MRGEPRCGVARGAILAALCSLTALQLSACDGNSQGKTMDKPPPPVAVAVAVAEDVPVYIDAVGKAVAREVVSIQPQVSGRIVRIHFADGAEVKTGDPLFTIDPRPYQAQLQAAEANLAEAEAVLSLARVNFDRVASVSDPRAISRQDYDGKKNAVELAEAQVKQQRAAVETARLNLEYCTIRSPINGRAGQRLVDLGNVVSANSGSLLVIQRLDPIYADFTVTEKDLSAVQRNMARGSLKVEVRLPDEPGRPRAGELTFIDNSVQEGAGTVRLRATLDNRDRRFWPGRFVNVRLILRTLEHAVLIPADAPQVSAKGPFAYVVKEDSSAELRPLVLGQRQGNLVVVERGVKAGERVVVQGQIGVTPGGKVRVQEQRSIGYYRDKGLP
ncbi:MAG TPA: efflux RND transporter periplasmic adaptor subunit [candidate division Zixibacteria bacterium]|nr:efflux RND transporter periplasmic adaptor subunit [candidate division Zixibacteria bacterium]